MGLKYVFADSCLQFGNEQTPDMSEIKGRQEVRQLTARQAERKGQSMPKKV